MNKQLRLPVCKGIKPPPPSYQDEKIAEQIARRIVAAVNMDECYWVAGEIEDVVYDVMLEIMRAGHPRTVFRRLEKRQPPLSCYGERATHPYGWEGIDDHCNHVADDIAADVMAAARAEYKERYDQ
jgi:hypothetical protein